MGWILSLKHMFGFACNIHFYFILFFLIFFYLICFCLTHSVMVLTHLAFALVIFISSLLLIICNFTSFFFTYITRSVKL